jgi:hypothetical protein
MPFATQFLAVLLMLLSSAFAAPSIKILAGLDKITLDDKSGYHPINGPIGLQIGYLRNIRYHGNNSPQENLLYHCIAKGRGKIGEKVIPDVCPQDYVTALVQWLFPDYREHGNFVVNDRYNQDDPVAFLQPKTIGQILDALVQAETASTSQKELVNSITQLVAQQVIEYKKREFEHIHKWNEAKQLRKKEALSQSKKQRKEAKETQKNLLQEEDPELEKYKRYNQFNVAKHKIQKGKIGGLPRKFAETLIGAFELIKKNQNGSQGEAYHPQVVTATLLAFAWEKANNKNDLVEMMKAMPHIIEPKALESYEKSTDEFTQQAYLDLKATINKQKELPSYYTMALAGLGYRTYEMVPPSIFYSQVKLLKSLPYKRIELTKEGNSYESLLDRQKREVLTFPDCGESTIRTLLNMLLLDPKTHTFNPDWLGVDPSNAVYQFYRHNPTVDTVLTTKAREEWAFISSRQKKILPGAENYAFFIKGEEESPQCSIAPGLKNFFSVLGALLEIKPTDTTSASTMNNNILKRLLERISKASGIQWTFEEGYIAYGKGVNTFELYRDRQHVLQIQSSSTHFGILSKMKNQSNWLERFIPLQDTHHLLPFYTPLLYTMETFPQKMENRINEKNLPDSSLILYSMNLDSVENQRNILEIVANCKSFLNLGKRLISALAFNQEDSYTQKKVFASIKKNNDLIKHLLLSWKLSINSPNVKDFLQDILMDDNEDFGRFIKENEINLNASNFLITAILNRNREWVSVLLKSGVNLNFRDELGVTPLYAAIKTNDFKVVKLLLDNGADPNFSAKMGWELFPLGFAVFKKNLEIIKLLLEKGADPTKLGEIKDKSAQIQEILEKAIKEWQEKRNK